MKLIVGLGNPGKKYNKTRHNVGFMVVDQYLKQHNVASKIDMRFESEIAQTVIKGEKVILIKPTTYMNLSGQAVLKVVQYFDIELADILVFVDDINLDTGRLRLRQFGGHGGHNGLKNINQLLKSNRYKRVRIGVDNNDAMPLDKYVLGAFNKEEAITIDISIAHCLNIIDDFVNGKPYSDIMTTYNTQT